MSRWSEHWSEFPKKFQENEFLKQVGKSVGGKEISQRQFGVLVRSVVSNLSIKETDCVLDLCSGNGLITSRVAPFCRQIVGIDQSEYLVEIAKQHNAATNTEYLCSSILDVDLSGYGKFSKIYMYEALQHFEESQLASILNLLRRVSAPNATILLASIPDKELIWEFYNTEERRRDYYRRKATGDEAIGTWWKRSDIEETAKSKGYSVEFVKQNRILHTAHYRFDLIMKPLQLK